jgi:hypothetical protein
MKVKKKKQKQPSLRFNHERPLDVGVPCEVMMIERLCGKCFAGLMRPTGKVMEIEQGRPGMIHACTNELCDGTLTVGAPNPPYPRPDFRPLLDIVGHEKEVGSLVQQMQAAVDKRKAEEEGADDGTQETGAE